MQKIKFFTLAIITMLSVNFAWGASPITLDVDKFGFSGTTYTTKTYTTDGVTFTMTNGAKNKGLAFKASATLTHNVAIPGKITNITLNGVSYSSSSSAGFYIYVGTSSSSVTTEKYNAAGTGTVSVDIDGSYTFLKIQNKSTRAMYTSSIVITYASATATITKTANLTNFTYEEGSGPSAAQSFTVGGSNLKANITVTAPTNFEVSKSSGSGYASSVTLTQSSGTVSNTTIYVRMKSGLSQGTGKGGDISLTSTGATTQTIAVVGTVTAPSYTVTAQSNNTELGTVSGTTTITASPNECVGYDDPAYTVAPEGKATVNQSGNTFTVSNVTADVTVTINFAELDKKDTYEDHLHNNTTIERCGSYQAPSLNDATKATTGDCDVVHYHFAGWVTGTIFTGTPGTPDDMITAGTNMTSNGRTYIAVWAKEE